MWVERSVIPFGVLTFKVGRNGKREGGGRGGGEVLVRRISKGEVPPENGKVFGGREKETGEKEEKMQKNLKAR